MSLRKQNTISIKQIHLYIIASMLVYSKEHIITWPDPEHFRTTVI